MVFCEPLKKLYVMHKINVGYVLTFLLLVIFCEKKCNMIHVSNTQLFIDSSETVHTYFKISKSTRIFFIFFHMFFYLFEFAL